VSARTPYTRRRTPRAARGFTLVELLVAIGILAMAAGGVIAVFAAATRSYVRGIDGTEAALIASSLVAEARTAFWERDCLKDASDMKVPGKPRYTYDLTYYELDRAGDEVLMRVRVRWSERGRETHLDFDTILFRKAE
jgi:prepilin-type N-terminal cleavage/methylation domain-containing protein